MDSLFNILGKPEQMKNIANTDAFVMNTSRSFRDTAALCKDTCLRKNWWEKRLA